MVNQRSEWPDGLTDHGAVLRLQSIVISGCAGMRDLSADRDYKRLRVPLVKRPDLADVVPAYVKAHRDLTSFSSYIKGVSDSWRARREHVWETFNPLIDRVEGRTRPPISSARWTGRRTAAQQAQVVLALAPDALVGVERLLEEQERALHNRGPVDPEQIQAIEQLKELHSALGELIDLAEAGSPLEESLHRLRDLKNRAFKWSISPYGLALGDMPLVAYNAVLGSGVMYLVSAITKGLPEAAAIGAATMGVHAAAVLQSRKNRRGPK